MDFKELQYVMSIAKHHNITKAAAGLYISQPSLSKYLQNLEANLELKLFVKKGNYFELTYAGERYLAYANEIIQLSNQLNVELDMIRLQKKGKIRIALPVTKSSILLPMLLPKFQKEYPDFEVELIEQPEEQLEEILVNKEVDLALIHEHHNKKGLSYELLAKEEIVIAVSSQHPILEHAVTRQGDNHPWIDIKELSGTPMIGYDKCLRIHHLTEQILHAHQMIPHVAIRTASIDAAVRMAAQGIGFCFVNDTELPMVSEPLTVQYLSFGHPHTTDDLVLAYPKQSMQSDHIKKWISLIRDYYKSDVHV